MSPEPKVDETAGLDPRLEKARRTALTAHGVVVRFQEMGLPGAMDADLSSLSTDLGDLWGAEKDLSEQVEGLLSSAREWETIGDYLVDIRATIEHIDWHLNNIRRPLNKLTHYAYRNAAHSKGDE